MASGVFQPCCHLKPCQVCPPPPLKHWHRHKARLAGEGVRGRGWGCLDSDALMPSDGRCISSDASACCLSSSCVVSLFPGCCFFFPFLHVLGGNGCCMAISVLWGMQALSRLFSVVPFSTFFGVVFLRPTPSHPLPSLGRTADHSARFARWIWLR